MVPVIGIDSRFQQLYSARLVIATAEVLCLVTAVVPGVTVTATQTETGLVRTVTTDESGTYVMPNWRRALTGLILATGTAYSYGRTDRCASLRPARTGRKIGTSRHWSGFAPSPTGFVCSKTIEYVYDPTVSRFWFTRPAATRGVQPTYPAGLQQAAEVGYMSYDSDLSGSDARGRRVPEPSRGSAATNDQVRCQSQF